MDAVSRLTSKQRRARRIRRVQQQAVDGILSYDVVRAAGFDLMDMLRRGWLLAMSSNGFRRAR